MKLDPDFAKSFIDENVQFWLDQDNPTSVYVEFEQANGARCLVPYGSEQLTSFLGYRYREVTGQYVNPNFDDFLAIKLQDTIYEAKNLIELNRRVCGNLNDKVVYFLADEKWQSVVITENGWEIVDNTDDVKFIKPELDEAQVIPKSDWDAVNNLERVKFTKRNREKAFEYFKKRGEKFLDLLKSFINLPLDDLKLLAACIIHYFCRSSSHYIAVISSGKGTGKSTLTKMIRSLVDPSKAEASLTPSNESELKNLLGNTYMACFDNTKVMKESYSNVLCAAITGTKEAKRKLYSDCDQLILNLHNIVVLNGIDIIPYKSDLEQRSLLFELQRIDPQNRKTDNAFWRDFQQDKPYILGAIFDILRDAMSVLPTISLTKLDRMADAHREMTAIAVALGISVRDFQTILENNHKKLHEAYIESNPFISTVVNYVKRKGNIDKPANEVFDEMRVMAVGRDPTFPGSPSRLSRRLKEEQETLQGLGIHFSTRKGTNVNHIILEQIGQNQPAPSQRNHVDLLA